MPLENISVKLLLVAPFLVWKVKIFRWVYYSTASTIRVGTVLDYLINVLLLLIIILIIVLVFSLDLLIFILFPTSSLKLAWAYDYKKLWHLIIWSFSSYLLSSSLSQFSSLTPYSSFSSSWLSSYWGPHKNPRSLKIDFQTFPRTDLPTEWLRHQAIKIV